MGYAACELAPDLIKTSSGAKIRANMEVVCKAKIPLPDAVWVVYVQRCCREHLEHERFDRFAQAFRPYRSLEDPKDRSVGDKHLKIVQ